MTWKLELVSLSLNYFIDALRSNYVAGRHSVRLSRWPSFFRTLPLKSDAISIGYWLWKGCKISKWRLRERLDFSPSGSFCCWHVLRIFESLDCLDLSGSCGRVNTFCQMWVLPSLPSQSCGLRVWKWKRIHVQNSTAGCRKGNFQGSEGVCAWCWSKHLLEQELFIYSRLQSWYKDRYWYIHKKYSEW